ncbi:MAG: hypothetical protein RL685_5655, partial [Pseudomonadota bacterium]
MTGADRARHGYLLQAMMLGMAVFVRAVAQDGTRGRALVFATCGFLVAAAACAIDDRTPSEGNGTDGRGPADLGSAGTSGGSSAPGGGPGSNGPLDVSGTPRGGDGTAPGSGDAQLGGNASGTPGLSGAGTNAGAGSAGSSGSGMGNAGMPSGACVPALRRCEAGALQLCNDDGVWAASGMTCGECVPDTSECAGSTLRVCSSTGVWIDRLQCTGSAPICQAASG